MSLLSNILLISRNKWTFHIMTNSLLPPCWQLSNFSTVYLTICWVLPTLGLFHYPPHGHVVIKSHSYLQVFYLSPSKPMGCFSTYQICNDFFYSLRRDSYKHRIIWWTFDRSFEVLSNYLETLSPAFHPHPCLRAMASGVGEALKRR